jgi:hypothetical protein
MDLFAAEKGLLRKQSKVPTSLLSRPRFARRLSSMFLCAKARQGTGRMRIARSVGSRRYAPQNPRIELCTRLITGATAHRYQAAPRSSGPFGHHKILHELRPHYTAASIYLGISPWGDTVPLSIVIGGTSTYDQCAHPSSCWVTCHNLG